MSDIALENGDVKCDARGFPAMTQGMEALIQRAMIRLSMRRGSFAADPELGSLLHTLLTVPPQQRDAMALSLARQALAELPEVLAEGATCTRDGEGLRLAFELRVGSELKMGEVKVQ